MTSTKFHIRPLTDKLRLQEIYNLRVVAWEHSTQKQFVNGHYFPDGWKDHLDEKAIHWIIEEGNKIVASSRICILNDTAEIEENFSKFELPLQRPFAFFSRLVVHPKFRNKGITKLMDNARLKFIQDQNINFALAYIEKKGGRKDSLLSMGFEELGEFEHQYGQNPKIEHCTALILHKKNIKL